MRAFSVTRNKGKRLNQYLSDYVVFDLETTGVRPDVDQIIEIAALRVREHNIFPMTHNSPD